MHQFFVSPDQVGKDTILITGSDAAHIGRVLRMRPGEELMVRTGEDATHDRCRIGRITDTDVELEILWAHVSDSELPSRICLFQCLPKGDKMEWIIQKAVELGVFSIIPVASSRCVMRLEGQKAEKKVQRWNAISENAAKQSKRSVIPQVLRVMSFAKAVEYAGSLDHLLIPYERAEDMTQTRQVLSGIRPGESVGIMIGPEGGLEESEVSAAVSAGAHAISLGKRILRTETAGLCVLSALMLQLDT